MWSWLELGIGNDQLNPKYFKNWLIARDIQGNPISINKKRSIYRYACILVQPCYGVQGTVLQTQMKPSYETYFVGFDFFSYSISCYSLLEVYSSKPFVLH